MNCEALHLYLNAALDGELSDTDRAAMDEHLARCTTCFEYWMDLQSLDRELSVALTPARQSIEPLITRVMQTIEAESLIPGPGRNADEPGSCTEGIASVTVVKPTSRSSPTSNRRSAMGIVAATFCTSIVAAVVMVWPSPAPAVAEIELTTGSVDVKRPDSGHWVAVNGTARVFLTAHSRVRTRPQSLCEIRTKSEAIVRLNEGTELILHRPAQVELVAGELWCRTSANSGVDIWSTAEIPSLPLQVFNCPSSTEIQWRTTEKSEVSCLDVSATPVDVKLRQMTCTIQPGECMTFQAGKPLSETTRSSPLIATNWQLPLLASRTPTDSEFQRRLTDILAMTGQSKVSNLYDQQIRQLGPAGAVPLLAFVRSADSKDRRDLRYRAMELAAELAARSSLADLEALLHDDDGAIRQLSAKALNRLQPDRNWSAQ